MRTYRKAAVLALGLALLSPLAGAQEIVDSEWWKVDFKSPTDPAPNGYGDVDLEVGELGALTNNVEYGMQTQPYASGVWKAIDSDESYVTNEFNPSAKGGTDMCLKLDTQGNDLTWTPTNGTPENPVIQSTLTLVDADLYLVGSESAPEQTDFDSNNDVQAAIFLKNEINEDGEVTNSVLCVYVDAGESGTVWQELEGRRATETNDIPENAWYRVQVQIDHTTDTPMVKVFVDGVQLHARGGTATEFLAAHWDKGADEKCIKSVSFRGTGAVDNFVGRTRKMEYAKAWFKAVVYTNDIEVAEMSQISDKIYDIGAAETPRFIDFGFDNYPDCTYALTRIEFENFETSSTTTYRYGYDAMDEKWPLKILDEESTNYVFFTIADDGDGPYQQGDFSVKVPTTAGATQPENYEDPSTAIPIVRIYYEDLPQPGDFKLTASQNVGENPADLKFNANDANLPTSTNFTFQGMIVQGDVTNVLRRVVVTNDFDVVGAYSGNAFTVTVPVEANKTAFSDKTIHVATATYAEGDYTDKNVLAVETSSGVFEVGAWVAKIGETNLYETLEAAIAAVPTDGTTTNIVLLADVTQDSTLVVAAGKDFTLDLGGHTITAPSTTGYVPLFENSGSMVLTNGAITASGTIVLNRTDATLVIADGTYTSGNHAFRNGNSTDKTNTAFIDATGARIEVRGGSITAVENCIAVKTAGSTVLVTGGTLTSTDNAVIAGNGTSGLDGNVITVTGGTLVGGITSTGYVACGIYAPNADTVTFGGDAEMTVTGGCGILARAGSVTVTGGSITTTGSAVGKVGDKNAVVPCAAIVFDAASPGYPGMTADSAIAVSGGTFVSDVNPVQVLVSEGDTNQRVAISGGSFSAIVPQEFCADGFVPVTTADPVTGRYTVKVGSIQVGTDTYGAFADAIPVHGWGATYTLLTNVEETVTITNAAEKLYVEVGDDADRTNGLEVVTTVEGDAQYAYTVKATLENGVVTYGLEQTIRSYDVVWHVESAESTNRVAYGETPAYKGETPTKEQDDANTYAFDGWSDVANGTKLDPLPSVNGPTNFYAVFTATPREYTITWSIDGAETTSKAAYGSKPDCPVTPAKPDADGVAFAFVGWAETAGATEANPDLPAAVTGEKTYYAVFAGDYRVYTIVYDLKGVLEAVEGANPAWSAENYVETNEFTVVSPDIVLPDPVCDGWAFQGWITNGYDAVLQKPGMVPTGSTTNYSFVAEWKEKVTAQFVSDGAPYTNLTVVAGEDFAAPEAPTKADAAGWRFAFANWTKDGAVVSFPTNIEEATTFTATFTSNAIAYTVVYDLAGGENAAANPAAYSVTDGEVALAAATKDYYDFAGWTNRNGSAATAIGYADADENDEISYGATWTPVVYTIAYVLEEGATNAAANPTAYTVETPTFALAPAGKDGFEFVGWVDENGATNAAPEIVLGSHGNRTFTAVFEDAAPPEVDAGEGLAEYKAENPEAEVPPAIEFDADEKCAVSFVAPAKGWYVLMTNATVTGTYAADVGSRLEVTDANVKTPVTLKESSSGTTRFFKIGWSKTEPAEAEGN